MAPRSIESGMVRPAAFFFFKILIMNFHKRICRQGFGGQAGGESGSD